MCDDYWLIARRTDINTFEYYTGRGWTQYPNQAEQYYAAPIDLAQYLDGLLLHVQTAEVVA